VVGAILSGSEATPAGYATLAAECRRRALACEDYTAARRRYDAALAARQSAGTAERSLQQLVRPPRREPWMTAG
jgi:hypothetical protein